MTLKSVDPSVGVLELPWDRVYPIPLPPFPLDPSAAPPGWASRIWPKTPKPSRFFGRSFPKPRTLTRVSPEGHFGTHLGNLWLPGFGVCRLGFTVSVVKPRSPTFHETSWPSVGQSVVGLQAFEPRLRSSETRLQTVKVRFRVFGPQTSKPSIP